MSKPIRVYVNPYADPARDFPSYHISLRDADQRVNVLGCAYWLDQRTIQYHGQRELQRSREELIAAGTFREAWKQIPSGPERMPVWQMPSARRTDA